MQKISIFENFQSLYLKNYSTDFQKVDIFGIIEM